MPPQRVVLAEYFAIEDRFLLLSCRSDFKQPKVVEITRSVAEVREFALHMLRTPAGAVAVAPGAPNTALPQLDEPAFHEFFSAFVAPILTDANEGDIVWMVPHDILHCVPLHAVAVEGRSLIERNPVCYTPTASVMRQCQAKRKGRHENALIVADPRNDPEHPPEEALAIAELFHTRPHLNRVATKSLVTRKLQEEGDAIDVLHFSCPAYFDSKQPLHSGIQLAAEEEDAAGAVDDRRWWLTAADILGFRTRLDLVTVSGCEPVVDEERPGEQLMVLANSLLHAGTPSVVVNLWRAPDLPTSLLMQRFYRELRRIPRENGAKRSMKATALQAAQKYVKDITARQIVEHCNQRLAALAGEPDPERTVGLLWTRADARRAAGDLVGAVHEYRDIEERLQPVSGERAARLAAKAAEARIQLQSSPRAKTPVDYDAKPCGRLSDWAPFVLIGDWS